MLTGIRVEEVMRNKVVSIKASANSVACAKIMARKKVGSVVVQENKVVKGILTEQDLARKVLAKGLNPKTTTVGQLMSKKVYTIEPEQDIYEAITKMGRQKIKHLPVVQNGKLAGIISYKDIIKLQPGLIELLSFKSSLSNKSKKAIFFNKE